VDPAAWRLPASSSAAAGRRRPQRRPPAPSWPSSRARGRAREPLALPPLTTATSPPRRSGAIARDGQSTRGSCGGGAQTALAGRLPVASADPSHPRPPPPRPSPSTRRCRGRESLSPSRPCVYSYFARIPAGARRCRRCCSAGKATAGGGACPGVQRLHLERRPRAPRWTTALPVESAPAYAKLVRRGTAHQSFIKRPAIPEQEEEEEPPPPQQRRREQRQGGGEECCRAGRRPSWRHWSRCRAGRQARRGGPGRRCLACVWRGRTMLRRMRKGRLEWAARRPSPPLLLLLLLLLPPSPRLFLRADLLETPPALLAAAQRRPCDAGGLACSRARHGRGCAGVGTRARLGAPPTQGAGTTAGGSSVPRSRAPRTTPPPLLRGRGGRGQRAQSAPRRSARAPRRRLHALHAPRRRNMG